MFYNFVMLVGFLTLSYYTAKILLSIRHKLYYKEWPKNIEEYKYFLLLEENKKLQQKVTALEEENAEMLNSIINNLKG